MFDINKNIKMVIERINRVNKKPEYNPEFLYKIQPAGGIDFKDTYTKTGSGYETCINIYGYPSNVDNFWLYKIMNMENVITSIDITSTEKTDVVSNINKSLREQLERYANEKDEVERLEARTKFSQISEIFNEISTAGETIKKVSIRIYVSSKSLDELDKKVNLVFQNLDGSSFKGTVFLNETQYEFQSLFSSSSTISKFENKRVGKEMGARTLAGGYPFHFTKMDDPDGTFLGTTFTGGNVLFNMFHKNENRKYYNGLCIGTMGSGKSTTLKKLFVDNSIRGNMIRGIDVTGEFENIIQKLHGKIVHLDGTDGIINPLQILRTSENETVSFMHHLSKVTTFYQFLSKDADDDTLKEFELLLRRLYIDKNIYKIGAKEEDLNVTNLKNEDYPIFSDLLNLVRKDLYEDEEFKAIRKTISESRAKRLESIELSLESICNNYGYLFNGISSIDDVTQEQIVFFSIRSLTSMKKEIFEAQMFNVLNIFWDSMLQNGEKMKKLYDCKQIKWDDITRFLILIDEAHRIINPDNLLAVKFLIDFEREARKYFAGLLFASPSIRSFVPEGTSSEGLNEIKTLFELTQYKFIMQQDSDTLGTFRQVFEGTFSESEIEKIPSLKVGECILAINSLGNISFSIEASENELNLFQGGA